MRVALAILLLAGLTDNPGAAKPAAVSILPLIVQAARERVNARWYPDLIFAYVDGERSGIAGFGKLEDGMAPNGSTVYEIGSITRTFTAALLAEAIKSVRVTPDVAVEALLPGLPVPARNGKQTTLKDLATQSSGLPCMPDNVAPADPANPFASYDAASLRIFLGGYRLKGDPGDAYEYSNLGFGLLGSALTQPQSYGAAMRAKIFQPLGMTMSGVGLTNVMKARLATGHNTRNEKTENRSFDVLAGCGGIDSTAGDMLRYLWANMLRTNLAAGKTGLEAAFRLAQQPLRDVDQKDRIGLAWMTRAAKASTTLVLPPEPTLRSAPIRPYL